MSFMQEFKEFAVKGNAFDMAIGIVLGLAFQKIIDSLVNDILMPPIGFLIGGVEFRDLQIVLSSPPAEPGGEATEAAIRYGLFINTLIEFLIVALALFLVVKTMNRLIRSREAALRPPPPPAL